MSAGERDDPLRTNLFREGCEFFVEGGEGKVLGFRDDEEPAINISKGVLGK